MNDTTHKYAERINNVIDYIGTHLDDDLSVEQLSRIAGFSKFHFHRQFTSYAGISVAQLVTLMRLKHASFQLAFNKSRQIIDIALDAGFSNPESFSRAFRKAQGQTPSQFRLSPKWAEWAKKYQLKNITRSRDMEVKIVDFSERRVAVLEHQGAPEMLMDSVTKFIEWRKSSKISPESTSDTFGVPHTNPEVVAPEDFRFDICGSINADVPANDYGVISKTIPSGRCAVARHVGSTDAIGDTVRPLYAEWLPRSDEELRDFPCFFHYIKRMPVVAEHEQVTDIYLPLR